MSESLRSCSSGPSHLLWSSYSYTSLRGQEGGQKQGIRPDLSKLFAACYYLAISFWQLLLWVRQIAGFARSGTLNSTLFSLDATYSDCLAEWSTALVPLEARFSLASIWSCLCHPFGQIEVSYSKSICSPSSFLIWKRESISYWILTEMRL